MNFKIKERLVQYQGHRVIRYFTSVDHPKKIPKSEVLERIAHDVLLPKAYVDAILESITSLLAKELAEGNIIEIPSLGTFKILAHGKSQSKQNLAGEKAVTKLSVNYNPSQVIKTVIDCG